MEKGFEEVGKGLINLSNLLMVVLFFKKVLDSGDINYFFTGLYFGVILYLSGFGLIVLSVYFEKE